jgi:hypothetical protein
MKMLSCKFQLNVHLAMAVNPGGHAFAATAGRRGPPAGRVELVECICNRHLEHA